MLIVEIISPSSGYRNRVEKRDIYQRYGVQEYWLVDPQEKLIEIFTLENGRYEPFSAASTVDGQLVSMVSPGLTVNVTDVF